MAKFWKHLRDNLFSSPCPGMSIWEYWAILWGLILLGLCLVGLICVVLRMVYLFCCLV